MKYFPETYLLPEQLEDYKRIHKVSNINRRNTKTEYTSVKPTEAAKAQESR